MKSMIEYRIERAIQNYHTESKYYFDMLTRINSQYVEGMYFEFLDNGEIKNFRYTYSENVQSLVEMLEGEIKRIFEKHMGNI